MKWRSLKAERRILCEHADMRDAAGLECHAFFDADGLQWWVSIDDHGIAWTWCTD